MTIDALTIPYPDFVLSTLIDPDQFDANNLAIKNKINELATQENTNTTNIATNTTNIATGASNLTTHKTAVTIDHPDNSVTDVKVGNRTIDQVLAGGANTGTLTELFSWIGKTIKAITGKTNWYDAPTKSIEQLNTDITSLVAGSVADGSITPAKLSFDPATQTELNTHASSVTAHAASGITAGTFPGQVVANNNTAYTTKQIRNVVLSTLDASGGSNGDVWIKYTA